MLWMNELDIIEENAIPLEEMASFIEICGLLQRGTYPMLGPYSLIRMAGAEP